MEHGPMPVVTQMSAPVH